MYVLVLKKRTFQPCAQKAENDREIRRYTPILIRTLQCLSPILKNNKPNDEEIKKATNKLKNNNASLHIEAEL